MFPFELDTARQTYVYRHGRRATIEIRLTTEGFWAVVYIGQTEGYQVGEDHRSPGAARTAALDFIADELG